jgi:hypothetical protein
MASPKFSFTFITQQEYDDRRKASAVAATTTEFKLPGKPPCTISVPVGVVSKLKKKNEIHAFTEQEFRIYRLNTSK